MWEKRANDCLLGFNLCLDQPLHFPLTFLPPLGSSSQCQTLPTGGIWSNVNRTTLNLNCKEILSFSKRLLIIMENIYWFKYRVIHKIEQQQWLKILLSCIPADGPSQFDLHHLSWATFGARSGNWCRLNETEKINKLNTKARSGQKILLLPYL